MASGSWYAGGQPGNPPPSMGGASQVNRYMRSKAGKAASRAASRQKNRGKRK